MKDQVIAHFFGHKSEKGYYEYCQIQCRDVEFINYLGRREVVLQLLTDFKRASGAFIELSTTGETKWKFIIGNHIFAKSENYAGAIYYGIANYIEHCDQVLLKVDAEGFGFTQDEFVTVYNAEHREIVNRSDLGYPEIKYYLMRRGYDFDGVQWNKIR